MTNQLPLAHNTLEEARQYQEENLHENLWERAGTIDSILRLRSQEIKGIKELLAIGDLEKQSTGPYDPKVRAYYSIIKKIRAVESRLHTVRFGKHGIYNFQEKRSSDTSSSTSYKSKKWSAIRICLVNNLRITYKAAKEITTVINTIQVTYPQGSLKNRKASDIIGQKEVQITNLAQLGSLEEEEEVIPCNPEELPDRRLYQVPKRKIYEEDEDEFSTISSEENFAPLIPFSEESDESDEDEHLFEVITTTSVAKIKQNPKKKQKTTHPFCDQKPEVKRVGNFITATKIKTQKSVTGILVEEADDKFKILSPNGETTIIKRDENWIQIWESSFLSKSESKELTLHFSNQEEEEEEEEPKIDYTVKTIKFDVIDLSDL